MLFGNSINVMDQTAQYKRKLIETLEAFDGFCCDNGLHYYACGGTAIGAVRHKGIIPWDDDIDVVMPRSDYDKMISLRDTLNITKYRIKTLGDEGYIYGFGKFYDNTTTLIEVAEFPSCVIGAYIDIFPLDKVSSNVEEVVEKKRKYNELFRLFQHTYYKITMHMVLAHIHHGLFRDLFSIISFKFRSPQYIKKVREDFLRYDAEWTEDSGDYYFVHHSFYPVKKEMLKPDWFEDYKYLPFDTYKIRIMSGYHDYLKQLFGDYMTPPPTSKQISQHSHYYLNLYEGLTLEEVKQRMKNNR